MNQFAQICLVACSIVRSFPLRGIILQSVSHKPITFALWLASWDHFPCVESFSSKPRADHDLICLWLASWDHFPCVESFSSKSQVKEPCCRQIAGHMVFFWQFKFLKLLYHSILSGIADNYIVRDPAGVQLFQLRPFKTDNMNSCHVMSNFRSSWTSWSIH